MPPPTTCLSFGITVPRLFRSSYLNKEKSLANNKLTCATSTHLSSNHIHNPPQTVPCHPIYMYCKYSLGKISPS